MFVVLFEDNPAADPDLRKRHMPDHLAFLEKNADLVTAAGPLSDELGLPAGGLWIVDASDRNRVLKLIRDDPFWPTGLRRAVRILAWKQVFADGSRLV